MSVNNTYNDDGEDKNTYLSTSMKDIIDNHEWKLIDIMLKMQDLCNVRAVLVFDRCNGYDFIEFIKKHS